MSNTHCKICLFANSTESETPCEYNIISEIKDYKEISILDNYFYVKNYKCLYGFSKELYNEQKENLGGLDKIKDTIIARSLLPYYLIVNLASMSYEQISVVIDQINNLEIKPALISFIINTGYEGSISKQIDIINNLSSNIKWKIHSFIDSSSFEYRCNIAAETNLSDSKSSFIMFYDVSAEYLDINNLICHAHHLFRVVQDNAHGIMIDKNKLNGTILMIPLFQSLINAVGGDIIKGLQMIENIIIRNYEK